MRRATSPPALLVLLLFVPLLSVAQRSGIGIKGGMLASHTRSGAYSSQYIPGATVGIYAPLLGSARFELQPEVLFTALGSGHTSPDGERYSVRTLYLQVPLSAKVYFSNVINVQAGVQASMLIGAQQHGAGDATDITDSYRPDEVAILLGLGADLRTGLDLTLRYHNGMTPVLQDDDSLFPRNQALMFTVGYRIVSLKAPSLARRRR
jgi:hypothetical protein